MPAISRPVTAVNESGFWMGQAANSLIGASRTVTGVWLAPLHASRGVVVRQTSDVITSMAAAASGYGYTCCGILEPANADIKALTDRCNLPHEA